jgi:hypothetical protein
MYCIPISLATNANLTYIIIAMKSQPSVNIIAWLTTSLYLETSGAWSLFMSHWLSTPLHFKEYMIRDLLSEDDRSDPSSVWSRRDHHQQVSGFQDIFVQSREHGAPYAAIYIYSTFLARHLDEHSRKIIFIGQNGNLSISGPFTSLVIAIMHTRPSEGCAFMERCFHSSSL